MSTSVSTLLNAFSSKATNLSYYTIPLGWMVTIFPHWYAVAISKRLSKGQFKASSPRQYLFDVQQKEKKTELDKRFIRAEAANANGFETLGLFAAAVVAGNVAKLPARELNLLSYGYLLSRVVFNLLYINVSDETASLLRSASYLAGIGVISSLFVKAGNMVM